MADIIVVPNFEGRNIDETSRLVSTVAVGDAIFTPEDITGFVANKYVVVGERGQDESELKKITSIAIDAVTVPVFLNKHAKLDQVTVLRYNQIKIYRAPNPSDSSKPADGAYVLLTTLDIQGDDVQTKYVDTVGSSAYWYKWTYFNSHTSAETGLSEVAPTRGGDFGHYSTVYEILEESNLDNNPNIPYQKVQRARAKAEMRIKSAIGAKYVLPVSEVSEGIKSLVTLLAAGYLLRAISTSNEEGTAIEGSSKIELAEDLIKNIQSGELTLYDINDVELTAISTDAEGLVMYPDSEDEDDAKFTMNDEDWY